MRHRTGAHDYCCRSLSGEFPSLNDLFFTIHKNLPREGPGNSASTLRAFRSVTDVTPVGSILDVGCGPGMQTVTLASATNAHIVALDTHVEYLEQLRVSAARERGVARIHALRGSMFDIPMLAESTDAIWAEGAIYIIGFERGLREWQRVVKHGGCVAVTHLSWLAADVPDEPRAFWGRNYPAMATVEENLNIAQRCGYDVVEHFTLPESAWWDDYYHPLEQRLDLLRNEHQRDADALRIIADTQEQIDLFRTYFYAYGYVFYVLRRT